MLGVCCRTQQFIRCFPQNGNYQDANETRTPHGTKSIMLMVDKPFFRGWNQLSEFLTRDKQKNNFGPDKHFEIIHSQS